MALIFSGGHSWFREQRFPDCQHARRWKEGPGRRLGADVIKRRFLRRRRSDRISWSVCLWRHRQPTLIFEYMARSRLSMYGTFNQYLQTQKMPSAVSVLALAPWAVWQRVRTIAFFGWGGSQTLDWNKERPVRLCSVCKGCGARNWNSLEAQCCLTSVFEWELVYPTW